LGTPGLKADAIGSVSSVVDLHWSISLAYPSKPWLPWKFLVQRSELGGNCPNGPPWLHAWVWRSKLVRRKQLRKALTSRSTFGNWLQARIRKVVFHYH